MNQRLPAIRSPCRRGVMLLEVVLALTILVAALAVIGIQMNTGLRMGHQNERRTQALMLAEAKLAQLDTGTLVVENAFDSFGIKFPGYFWRFDFGPHDDIPDMFQVRLDILYRHSDVIIEEGEAIESDLEEADVLATLHALRPLPPTLDLQRDFGLSDEQLDEIAAKLPPEIADPSNISPSLFAEMDPELLMEFLPQLIEIFGQGYGLTPEQLDAAMQGGFDPAALPQGANAKRQLEEMINGGDGGGGQGDEAPRGWRRTGETLMRRRAFTLLEVMLSLSLLVLLLGFLFQFYFNAMKLRQRGVNSTADAHLARVLLRQITGELRGAVGFAPGFGPGVIGERYEFTMQTATVPSKKLFALRSVREDPLPGQHDVKQVRYFIAWDEDITDEEGNPLALGLVRQELKTLRQAVVVAGDDFASDFGEGQQGEVEDAEESFRLQLYAPEIKYLELRYYDGARWHRDWNVTMGNALPQMVRVTIGYETQEQDDLDDLQLDEEDVEFEDQEEVFPPRSYTAYVRVKQADTFFGSRLTRAASTRSDEGL